MRGLRFWIVFVAILWTRGGYAADSALSGSVFLEELTSPEVAVAIRAGKTTVIVPTGGTEQNGPHMVLGKHNYIVSRNAGEIARRLGNALVAPVMAYVPEGNIDPPEGHMHYPGTISLPEEYFIKVVEYAARSLRAGGFKDIVLIGDSGPNQHGLESVAQRLSREWIGSGVRVHYAGDYYDTPLVNEWLKRQGLSIAEIGTHAGVQDTSELMALHPEYIRRDKLSPGSAGVDGNPARASAAYGRQSLEFRVGAAVTQIRRLMAAPAR